MKSNSIKLLLVIGLLGLSSNQAVTRGYFYSNIGTTFAWSGSAQSEWSGSTQAATCSDYSTYIRNDGTACTPSNSLVTYGFATSHAVVSNIHTPILSANTFAGGAFYPWTSANAGSCAGGPFSATASTDEDGDNGYAVGSSSGCVATPAQVTLAQTFTTGGAPTSQSYSFYYKAKQAVSGSASCTLATGTASLSVKIGSTTIATPTLTLDGAWHQVSGTTTAMVSGSNTLTFTATLAGANGQKQFYSTQIKNYVCRNAGIAPQTLQIDNVVLTGTW